MKARLFLLIQRPHGSRSMNDFRPLITRIFLISLIKPQNEFAQFVKLAKFAVYEFQLKYLILFRRDKNEISKNFSWIYLFNFHL